MLKIFPTLSSDVFYFSVSMQKVNKRVILIVQYYEPIKMMLTKDVLNECGTVNERARYKIIIVTSIK